MRGGANYQFNPVVPLTPAVKILIIVNASIWLFLLVILQQFFLSEPWITLNFGFVPEALLYDFYIWQVVSYMFIHSLNWPHIVFNMLMLWWLGSDLEQRWGSKFFVSYYFVTGIGAALIYMLCLIVGVMFFSAPDVAMRMPVVGASGAIFGLLLAYGILFGERVVYFLMLFPMKAKYFVMLLGGIELVTTINSGVGGQVANLAHLAGLVSGFLFLRFWNRWQKVNWKKKGIGHRSRNLKLVVDNERNKQGPRYWN